jgi:hypothetical protein
MFVSIEISEKDGWFLEPAGGLARPFGRGGGAGRRREGEAKVLLERDRRRCERKIKKDSKVNYTLFRTAQIII